MTRVSRKNARVGASDLTANPNLLRVLSKLSTGAAIKVTFIGDSGLEGNTVTTPGTDDAASRFCAGLAARFGVTVTKSNRAVSGNTLAHPLDPTVASPTRFTNAITDAADLYVISYGHNDIRCDFATTAQRPGTGYPITAGRAALEYMIRRIRRDVPEADILISNEWPYTNASTSNNAYLVPHGNMLRRVAAQYGCAFADYYGYLTDLGVNNGTQDTYVWAVGASGPGANAQHPNDNGHRAWADLFLSMLPALAKVPAAPTPPILGSPIFGAERYSQSQWVDVPLLTGPERMARWRVVGTWTSSSVTPTTGSVASSYAEVQFIGTECKLRLDNTTGYGVVKIELDGITINATLDLSIAQGGGSQPYFPLTGLAPGAHRVVITVVSGTVNFRGATYLPSIGQRMPYTSALCTFVGTWAPVGTDSAIFERNANSSTTQNDTVTVPFIGTALAFSGFLYAAAWLVGLTVDGATEVVQDWNIGTGVNQQGCRTIVSGLAYGRHTVVLRIASTSGTRALNVAHFFAYDEDRVNRPFRTAGLGIVGESPNFGNTLPGVPLLTITPDDATSTAPGSSSAATTTGFTLAGTASSRHQWMAETGRLAY